MPTTYYKQIVKELNELGFLKIAGGKGSHEKWVCRETGKTIIVPHGTKSRHTANGILKSAGSDKKL